MHASSSAATKFRWVVGTMLFFAAALNYIDRAALPVVAPMVSKELGIDTAHLGLIFSIFFVGYAVFNFVGGFAADKFGPKRVYGIAMAGWSVFSGLTAIVTGFWQLMIFRIIFGLAEGPMGSVSNKTVRDWFPRQEAGFVVGMATSGGNLAGAAVAAPLMGFIALSFGWRMAFLVTLVLGAIWLVPWLTLVSDRPAGNKRVSAQELAHIEQGRQIVVVEAEEGHKLSWYLTSASILVIAFAFFAANYTQYLLLSWLPSYLISARHLDIKSMSIVAAIPWIAGLVGCFLGGLICDRLVAWIGNPVLGRKIFLIVTLLLNALGFVAVMFVSTTTQAVGLMSFVLFIEGMIPLACWALVQELVTGSRVGGVGGFVHFLSNTAGMIGPAATGYVIQYGGGYNTAFALAAGIAAVAAIGVSVFLRPHALRHA